MSDNSMNFPGWYRDLLSMTEKDRQTHAEKVLEEVERLGSFNDKPTSAGIALVKMLRKECVLGGFSPNVYYARHKSLEGGKDLADTFIHKWGCYTLIYHHKTLPITIEVNPWMMNNDVFLRKIGANRRLFEGVYVVGYTG
jgi:hypothetical protein